MGVYRRGKIWWIDYYSQSRERVQESSQSPYRRDAENLLATRKTDVMRGGYKTPVKITLDEFGKRYMVHAKANKRSWLRDQQMLKHLKQFFGNERQLTDMAPAEIEGYKVYRRGQVSGSTVNRELALLKRMFNLAINWDLFLNLNPVRRVKFFREFNIRSRVLSPEEERKLLPNAAPFLQDLMRFALSTGLRTGELFSLQWSNVNWENGVLNVFAAKTGKTRTVPLNAEARKILESWQHGRKNEHVFYNHGTGKPFVDLKAGFALACRKAEIEGVTWHTLRHTFASRLLDRGVDVVTVKELLGHSSITVTMRYTHTNLDSKKAAVAKLESSGDTLVTVCTKKQQPVLRMSPKAPLSIVASYT
jgi:integrase